MSETETARESDLDTLTTFVLAQFAPEFSSADEATAEAGRAVWQRHRNEAIDALDNLEARLQHLTQALEGLQEVALSAEASPVGAVSADVILRRVSRAFTPTTPADSTSPTSPGTEPK